MRPGRRRQKNEKSCGLRHWKNETSGGEHSCTRSENEIENLWEGLWNLRPKISKKSQRSWHLWRRFSVNTMLPSECSGNTPRIPGAHILRRNSEGHGAGP